MQEGTLAPGVQEWRLRVEVNGVGRVAESVSIDADVASDLPDQVAGVSGVSARTGSIQWAPQNPVSERPATPWTRSGAWPPQPGDTVDIWAGDENTSWKVFTGRIDTSEGGVDSFSSKIIDATDQLDRPISLDPVAHTMPGAYDETTDAGFDPVRTFVQPWHAAYRAMRAGGFGVAAPRQTGGWVVLDVDFQGSVWPAAGALRHTTSSVDAGLDWGEGFTYLSAGTANYTSGTTAALTTGRALRVWGRKVANGAGTTTINTVLSDGKQVRTRGTLNATMTTLTVTVELFQGEPSAGVLLGSGSVSAPAFVQDGSIWFEVAFQPGSSTVTYTVPATGVPAGTRNGDAAGTFSLGVSIPAGVSVSNVGVGAGAVAARVGVLASWAQWTSMSSHVTSSRVRAWGRGLVNSQYVSRTQVKRNARDLLAEIGAATLTAMWIDEHGVMQWAPTNVMYLGSPVRTFTTRDDIFELGWVESLQATRHQVFADFENVALKVSTNGYTKTVWRAQRAEEIANGTTEEFIEVPGEQEWFGVDTSMWRGSAVVDRFNARKGSFYQAVKEVGNDEYLHVGSEYVATLEKITPRTFKLTHTNTYGSSILSQTSPDLTSARRSLRDFPLPIIRGLGVADFIDDEVIGASTGPSWAADMNLDLGAWAIKGHAQNVVDWLSNKLSSPVITLTDVEVDYDPRIQLGDMIMIESLALLGMRVSCVVVGKSETHGQGASMSLTVRVVGTYIQYATYGEFEAAYQGQQYAALESAWSGATYGGFENAPLGRI